MRVTRVVGGTLLALVLLAGAAEAVMRTNPVTHPPQVRRSAPGQVLESLDTTAVSPPGSTFSIVEMLSNQRLAAVDADSVLHVLSPAQGAYEASVIATLPADALGIASSDTHLVVACAWAGTEVFRLSGTGELGALVRVPPGSSARSVVVEGDYAYVADWESGLQLISLEEDAAGVLGFYDTPGHAYDVATSRNRVYIADFEGGVRVVDVSSPTAPKSTGVWQMMPAATGVATQGDHVFVADEQRGLFVVDVRRPDAPRVVAELPMEVSASDVAVAGSRAIVSDRAGGLSLFDISDPSRVRPLGRTQYGGAAVGVEVDGHTVYLAAGRLLMAEVPE